MLQYLGYGLIGVAFVWLMFGESIKKFLVKVPGVEKAPVKEAEVELTERCIMFDNLDYLRDTFAAQKNMEGLKAVNEAGRAMFQDKDVSNG